MSAACGGSEYRRLDFWIGDWDAYDPEDLKTPSARTRVEAILGGCALQEMYEGNNGTVGESFTIYDAGRRVWHQSWVTNRGRLLTIEGRFDGDSLTLEGPQYGSDGRKELIRGTWRPQQNGVRETAHSSTNEGASWKPLFDILFLPHKASAAMPDRAQADARAVADLDERYQAAVKSNDAETMAKILADDFVLVTGRGRAHNKAELVEDARKKTTTYEHQEDTERTVRVWGDTAVVTALLWEKGVDHGKPFDYHVWFSDTYVRTTDGWKYVFGQSSLPLPGP
jgi:uncharacterized protein (TIGR02246 family)